MNNMYVMMQRMKVSREELIVSARQDRSRPESAETPTKEIDIPDGYELAFYTLRSLHNGHLQSYKLVSAGGRPVQAVPIAAQLLGVELSEQSREDHQTNQSKLDTDSSSLSLTTDNSPEHSQTPTQQDFNTAGRGSRGLGIRAQGLSARTLKRYAHERNDEYTDVCGIYSPEVSTPVKRYNHGKGKFCCPRCGSNFTRPKSVKDHFPSCIMKFGNPQALRYTDHTSMAQKEAAIQGRAQASRETSTVDMEDEDVQMDGDSQGIKFEELNEALYAHLAPKQHCQLLMRHRARTSLHITQDHRLADHDPIIKTEFVPEEE